MMAFIKTLISGLAILAISNHIKADEEANARALGPFTIPGIEQGGFQFPSIPGLGSEPKPNFPGFSLPNIGSGGPFGGFFSSGFSVPGFNFPIFFGLFGNPFTSTPVPAIGAVLNNSSWLSRKRREAHGDHESHHRFLSSRLPSITSCNYTTQAGISCSTCNEALFCFPNNVGLLTPCRGLFRHCNNGRCSFFQSSECSNSTTTGSPSG